MENLFVYGTLREPEVQKREVGRVIKGRADILDNYEKSTVVINGNVYPIVEPKDGSLVEGLVLKVTSGELKLLDVYETDAYRRVKVTLKSNLKAWVYQR